MPRAVEVEGRAIVRGELMMEERAKERVRAIAHIIICCDTIRADRDAATGHQPRQWLRELAFESLSVALEGLTKGSSFPPWLLLPRVHFVDSAYRIFLITRETHGVSVRFGRAVQ